MPQSQKIAPNNPSDWYSKLVNHLTLVWKLMGDKRVNFLVKLIPFSSLVYLLSPFDIPTPIDDALVVWGSTHYFVELCPPEIVAEHRAAIEAIIPGQRDSSGLPEIKPEDIIDAEYSDD
ncbi:MAG: hypothetical protein OEZ02_04445 [Anaerolineae bacterium]|nr:hypothetical protein [Anaerolineae bacterium]